MTILKQICIARWLLATTEENRVHSERYQAKHLSLAVLLLLKWGKFLNYLTLLKSNYLQPPRVDSAAERKILSSIQICIQLVDFSSCTLARRVTTCTLAGTYWTRKSFWIKDFDKLLFPIRTKYESLYKLWNQKWSFFPVLFFFTLA